MRPKSKQVYKVIEDRRDEPQLAEELEKVAEEKRYQQLLKLGVDTEAARVKKGNRVYYGYKKHIVTDNEGLIYQLNSHLF